MILCLSCVVVFCTVYALILPAITLERKTVCGQEEHSHTEECYASDGQLTCGKTEHTHTESCYADDKTSEDQSGEDSQQTPEQNQTEGQEQNSGQSQEQNQNQNQDQSQSQNQAQASDDGNVAQNGENGDTAGTTADETSGNDEESVVAGSTSVPAAEGEDGTGSTTTTTEGFDLSADEHRGNVKDVKLQYYNTSTKVWVDIPKSGGGTIPGDAEIKLIVNYYNVPISQLKDDYSYTMTYDMPEIMRHVEIEGEGKIMEGNNQVGTITVKGRKIVITFAKNYLDKLTETTIKGDFYIKGGIDLSKLPETGKTEVTTAGKKFTLDFGEDPIAQYGKVDIKKECADKVISKADGDYISYTITVTAGEDGCPDVSVVDTFGNRAECVSNYVGIEKAQQTLKSKSEVSELSPYEEIDTDKTHGSIYIGKSTTDTENPIPKENTTGADELGSMVWKIGKMEVGESRKLTYYVKLKDGLYMNQIQSINNQANVYSKKYHKGYGDASFEPKINYDMKKTSDRGAVRNEDGTYTIEYKLVFTLEKDSSNYPLKNFEFLDYLNHNNNSTDSRILPYINYNSDSFRLEKKVDGSDSYQTVDANTYEIKWSKDKNTYGEAWSKEAKCFSLSGSNENPLIVNPGDSYCLTYCVTVQPEAMAVMKANSVQVKNRWIVAASNAYSDKFAPGFEAYNQNVTIDGYTWNEKVVRKGSESNQLIELVGSNNQYDLTKGNVEKDNSTETAFTIPAGSYQYVVKVNETKNDWDATGVSMTDTLTPVDKIQYTGYAKVEACEYNANADKYEVKETKWVKIDGLTTFTLKPSNLGWEKKNYAYRFTYYATPVNKDSFSEVPAKNKFELKGTVGRGEKTFAISGIYSQTDVTISGNYSMNVKKEAWYYEKAKDEATEWTNGKIYWVIEVSGTAILQNTAFKDKIVLNSEDTSLKDSYLHSDSLEGIYIGKLEEGKTITGYKTLEELQKSGNFEKVTSKFTSPEFKNNAEVSEKDIFSEFTIKANEKIELGEKKLYFIVRTEPKTLPTNYRDAFTYRNEVSTSDDGEKWIPQSTADKNLCGGAAILKELGQTFTYDGTTVKSNKDGKDQDYGNNKASDKIAASELDKTTGPGQYAAWVFKLNYAGELSGTYRVLETIPDGMELAYIRIKWVGSKQKEKDFVKSKDIAGLDEGWTRKQTTARTDDAADGDKTTTYYVKGNQALIALGDFYPGKSPDTYSVDVQVVCKVTDPEVLLGGAEKKFVNNVTLQTEDGQDIRSAFATAVIKTKNLDKTVKNTEPNKDERVHFTIKANELGQTLPTKDGQTLKLIDKLSPTLILDTSTIKVVDSNTNANVNFTASLGADNTLEIQIPCNEPVTITYTATVNAPPDQEVSFSNSAYWESYTPTSGSGVKVDNYSYSAGGTITTGDNIKLKIIKKDQNNLSLNLSGAKFEMVKCKRTATPGSKEGTITEMDGSTKWTGTTDESGTIVFGDGASEDPTMDYNTIYKVTEITAPDGYVKDDTPYYIMVPKKETDGKYSEEVQGCIDDPQIKKQYMATYELTVTNHKGEITVEKKFKNPGGQDSNPVSGIYKFGLYEKNDATNQDRTSTPKQTIYISYTAGEIGTKSNKFVDLDLAKTYYVFELDDQGNPIKDSSTVAIVNRMEYLTSYTTTNKGSTTTGGNSASNGDTVTVTNQSRVNKLPSTGSCGVLIYRLAGAILILFAVVLMLMKYKETKTRN